MDAKLEQIEETNFLDDYGFYIYICENGVGVREECFVLRKMHQITFPMKEMQLGSYSPWLNPIHRTNKDESISQ